MENTEKKRKNNTSTTQKKLIKVAVFCIAALVLFIVGTKFLRGMEIFGEKNIYHVVFEDIGSLHNSSSVFINGYKIGKINKLVLNKKTPTVINAEILITEDIDIPKDSYLEVVSRDLLGSQSLNLVLGQSGTFLQTNDTLKVQFSNKGLNNIMDHVENIVSSLDTVSIELKSKLVDDSTLLYVKDAMAHIESIAAEVDKNKDEFSKLMNSLLAFGNALTALSPQLTHAVSNISDVSDSLAQIQFGSIMNEAQQTIEVLKKAIQKIESGDGNMSMLLNDKSLYINLQKSTEQLEALLKDIQNNPKKYINISIFGKSEKNK
jgi:phospholipid/cholesterol/gamma-HCH transport system substrate-binding protein